MKEFHYNNNPQEQAVDKMLKAQNRRLGQQQMVFAGIFFSVVAILTFYVINRTVYATYDGYIKLDENKMRAVEDIFVLDIYKQVGDSVHQGDTLYSYVLIDNIMGQYDVNNMPSVIRDSHDMELQAKLAREEIPVLRTRLAELRKQKAGEANDIYYGLTDNTKQNQLNAEIAQVQQELRKQMNKVAIYASMRNSTWKFMANRSGSTRAAMPYSRLNSNYSPGLIHYCIAPANSFVTDINVTKRSIVFKEEPVLAIQHTDYQSCHLGVLVYVPNDKVKFLACPDDAEIIVNKDVTLKARLAKVGLRVETIPRHLLSNFSHDADAVIAYYTFLPYQQVPDWVMTNKLPVRVRLNKLKALADPRPLPQYIIPDEKGRQTPPDTTRRETPAGRRPANRPPRRQADKKITGKTVRKQAGDTIGRHASDTSVHHKQPEGDRP